MRDQVGLAVRESGDRDEAVLGGHKLFCPLLALLKPRRKILEVQRSLLHITLLPET